MVTPATLPGHRSIGPEPEIDIEALSRAAARDDESPVVVTRRYLRQVERELRAAQALRAEAARLLAMQAFIAGIAVAGSSQGKDR